MLTLFVIESPNHPSQDELLESFGNLVDDVLVTGNQDFNLIQSPTEYFMLMYSAERIDEGLKESLPAFIESGTDIFIFYKLMMKRDEKGKVIRSTPYIAPRLFKDTVKLRSDCILPVSYNGHSFEKILNGWILEWH